jgi:putative transposase
VAAKYVVYGSRRVTRELRMPPYGMKINRKRTQRLMRVMSLQRSQKRRKHRTTDSRHGFARYHNLVSDIKVTFPDQV